MPGNIGHHSQIETLPEGPAFLRSLYEHAAVNARALQDLQESEERFRAIFNDAPAGMALSSTNGRFIVVNKALCDLLGYGRNELTVKDLVSITYSEDREQTLKEWSRLREDNTADVRVERRYVHKNGDIRWGEVSTSFIHDSQTGKPKYILSQIVDITERKRFESELKQRQSELKEAQRLAQIGSWSWARESGAVSWSSEMYHIHGLDVSRPPLSFGELAQFFKLDSWQRLKAAAEEACETGRPVNLDLELVRPDGKNRWISLRGEAERDLDGRVVRLRGTAQDITERKLAEEALRETETRFRTIANSAPVLIWMAGPDKLCTYFNRTWLEFTGRPLEAELGNGWMDGVHADDLANYTNSYARAFDGHVRFTIEYRLRRHDGDYRWVLDTGVPRFNPDGSFAGYIGSCIDQTDRRAAEEVLRNISRKLIDAQEKERRRIARELHDDINQRLAMLAIELQQLELPRMFSSRHHERIDRLFKHTMEISSAVQALSHELHSASLEHLGLVAAMKSFCNELARHQKVKVEFVDANIPDSIPEELSLALFRVLQEGLHNAVKHSGVRKFKAELVGEPGAIQLKISDAGAGFSPDQVKGQGLGLLSMQERVLPFKGTLSIHSKPKHGTDLIVRVPMAS